MTLSSHFLKKLPRLAFVSLLLTSVVHAEQPPAAVLPTANSQPADRPDIRVDWLLQHQIKIKHLQERKPDVVFLGDSITAGWHQSPLFAEKLTPLTAYNAGIGGDSTQHVLWRVIHGAVETQPKVVVLLIGINNLSNGYTPTQVISGITAIVREIQQRSPESKILLMGIFPRGEAASHPARQQIAEVNREIATLADSSKVIFLDIGQKLLKPDGRLTKEISPDGLHLAAPGYAIWFDAIHPLLLQLLEQKDR